MKIHSVTLHNIASFADATVDFDAEPLASAEVFLITGRVGAGKSTILDGISLALFGVTPRLQAQRAAQAYGSFENAGVTTPRQILRTGCAEGRAELLFEAGGAEYRAVWKVDRSRAGGVNELVDLSSNHTYTGGEAVAAVERILGMTFDQFCRTTLLAQGDFARFLKSDDNGKSLILQRLIGEDIYERVGMAINERKRTADAEYKTAKTLYDSIRPMTGEEEKTLKRTLKEVRARLKESKAAADKITAEAAWVKQFGILSEALARASREDAEARADCGSEKTAAMRALVAEYALTTDVRNEYSRVKPLREEIAACERSLGAWAADSESLALCVSALDLRIKDSEAGLPQSVELPALRENLDRMNARNIELRDMGRDIDDAVTLAKEKKELSEQLDAEQKRLGELDGAIPSLQELYRQSLAALESVRHNRDVAFGGLDDRIESLRAMLREGDRCPVCGTAVGAVLPVSDVIRKAVADLDKTVSEMQSVHDANGRRLSKAQSDRENADLNVKRLDKEIKQKQAACDRLNGSLSRRWQSSIGRGVPDKDVLDAEVSRLKEEIARQTGLIREAEALEALRRMSADANAALAELNAAVGDIEVQEDEIKSSHVADSKLASEIRSLTVRVRTSLNDCDSRKAQLRKSEAAIEAFLDANPGFTRQRLDELCAVDAAYLNTVNRQLRQKDERVAAAAGALSQCRIQLDEHRKSCPPSLSDLADNALPQLAQLEKRQTETATEIADCQSVDARIVQQLENNQELKVRRKQLREDKDRKDAALADWKVLDSMFGTADGKRFRTIALSYILGGLIERANTYMQSLTDRYRLSVHPGTFIILVEDAYQGYARRPATSISGGESFIVSLSLALALSDISEVSGADILFIDEGFGSLSGRELDNAIAMLQNLHSLSRRRVGIISHLPRVSESLPVQIQVARATPLSSSSLTVTTIAEGDSAS